MVHPHKIWQNNKRHTKEESFPLNVPQKMFALNVVSKKLPKVKDSFIEKNPLLEINTQ